MIRAEVINLLGSAGLTMYLFFLMMTPFRTRNYQDVEIPLKQINNNIYQVNPKELHKVNEKFGEQGPDGELCSHNSDLIYIHYNLYWFLVHYVVT